MEVTTCIACASHNQSKLSAEICIHFPTVSATGKADLLLYRTLVVCSDCGLAQFEISSAECTEIKGVAMHAVGAA